MSGQPMRSTSNGYKFFHLMLAITIFMVLICSATISSILYTRWNQTLNKQNEEFMRYAASQALNGIENMMRNCESTARNIYSDSTVASLFLGADAGNVNYTLFHQFMLVNNSFENYVATNSDIKSIVIYKLDPALITDGKNIRDIESFERQDLMRQAIDARGKEVWVTFEEEGEGTKILLLKYININRPGGVLAIEMNQARLSSLYKGDDNAKYLLYLLSDGRIMFRSNPDVRIGRETLNDVERSVRKDQVFAKFGQGRAAYYSYSVNVNEALSFVILYDAYELGKEKRSIAKYVWLCTGFFVLIGVALAIWFSTRFAHIIERLANKMKAIEQGKHRLTPDATRIREIAALDRTLCRMAQTIDGLTEDVARTERQKVESEIKYLQMQMNPHFLYNLLSAVRWMAFRGSETKIVQIIDLLSDFYKIALSKGKDVIALKSEIELIEHYVALHNCCLHDQIELTVRVDPACEQVPISKMTLQPFVENSIIHGRVHGRMLHIEVDIRKQRDRFEMTIRDDGMGVKDEFIAYIDSLNKGETSAYRVGYGVTNTFARLKLFDRHAEIRVRRGDPGTIVELSFSVERQQVPEAMPRYDHDLSG
ncbi:sensor histidine kinase [Paenibacillus methanolicus]|uniref:Histidine kinase n=1 Tax=Paenibacillus methanolicus TaxID=582686 RepID=A0A5S5CJN9_9BACL|nr:histidine kinase [Paenibacillus methanolicus]TYP78965.1 histidine kinase [Paenibacillus methanolicus]